ncbi:hypothetical protein NM688_g5690 [Phlebia brevispora]|uniref:Uncharacterized protein n=1 Tax=Phlebia brevispora TaxID=194682 RepID=A0ACC1SRA1_9APHY|nr:hypothetical protein NM688_g5690 [Phlebia brevispora]
MMAKPPASKDSAAAGESTPIASSSKGKGRALGRQGDSAHKIQRRKTEVVPSSHPHEECEPPSTRKKARAAPTPAKGKKRKVTPPAPAETPSRTRSLRSAATGSTRKNYYESSENENDDDKEELGDLPPLSDSDDNDARTEQEEDEEEMEVDEPSVRATRKRKRASSVPFKKPSKAASKLIKQESETPEPRAKRRKSGSLTPSFDIVGMRVFALWRLTNSFYSGTVRSACPNLAGRYNILFDDTDTDTVAITKLRRCELRVGDNVQLAKNNQQAVVVDVSRFATEEVVTIEIDDGTKHRVDMHVKGLMIASRTITTDWKDRMLCAEDTVLEGSSVPPSSSQSGKLIFHRTAFVLSFSPGFHNVDAKKGSLASSIKKCGGTVLDDWASLFTLDGHYTTTGKKWHIRKEDVKLSSKYDKLSKVFLLSDEPNHKPRFLIALALGIPCLNVQWLHYSTEANEAKDWRPYLLPAGTSEKLDGRVSQMVDLDWGESPRHLSDIMQNLVAAKPFAGKKILCLSPDFVPRKNDNSNPLQMIPRIVLCMGANQVDAVSDVKQAGKVSEYDYVVLKDEELHRRHNASLKGATCVGKDWVKECLVASRLLPLDYD